MALEFRLARPALEQPLTDFFAGLVSAGDGRWFHPHPLDRAEANRICSYDGQDVYYVAVDDGVVLGYAFLRGWDEGFSVPSLGIAVDASVRGQGVGRALMELLHLVARRRGSERVRLKVYPENANAVDLYRSLGYVFDSEDDGQLVGLLELS
jgi:ribosomal-protein-alanine N-acetyltransferase